MRSLVFGILMLSAGGAMAGGIDGSNYSFAIAPNPPLANLPFQVQVTFAALTCYAIPDAITISQPSSDVIQYELRVLDSCLPFPEQQRTYPAPPLSPGQYTLRLAVCVAQSAAQLPTAPCAPVSQLGVVIAPPSVIPALSSLSLSLLAGIMTALSALFVRRS